MSDQLVREVGNSDIPNIAGIYVSARNVVSGEGDLRSCPYETSVVSKIPGGWVDHVWCENVHDDCSDIVCRSTHCDGLDLESSG